MVDNLKWDYYHLIIMVEFNGPQLDQVFHAISNTTRRKMLLQLANGERTVSQLAKPFLISLAAASKHIKTLENAGLIRREVHGRTHTCYLTAGPLASAQQWLIFYKHFWTDRLNDLDQLLRKGQNPVPLSQDSCFKKRR